MRMIHYFHQLYSWVLPYTCVLCHHPSTRALDLCEPCFAELPILPHSCPRCARPLPFNHVCGECLKFSPPFAATYTLFSYEQSVKNLILNLKFNGALVNAKILSELLAEKIKLDWYEQRCLPDIIIPMPLHRKRIQERGFNQAVEIAQPIAKKLKIPIDLHSCHRVRHTAAQATLLAEQRRENIRGAFLVNRDFTGKHVAVIDDVITTGQTMIEFTKMLKKAGATQIDVWCCARVLMT